MHLLRKIYLAAKIHWQIVFELQILYGFDIG